MSRPKRAATWTPPPWALPAAMGVGLAALTVWAWPARPGLEPRVREGNAAFEARRYGDALQRYEAAPGDGVQNVGVHMNRGLARYRLAVPPGDASMLPELERDATVPDGYELAQNEIRNAARGMEGAPQEDIEAWLRARAAYNLGNTYFSEHAWQSAIDMYKEALRLRPGWVDAAWNLELARRRKDDDEHPDAGPDASQDASQDASEDASQDASQDASRDGSSGDAAPGDGGGQSGDGGQQQPDAGSQGNDASSQPPDSGGGGDDDAGAPPPEQSRDAGAAPPPPPTSLAPLDQLERSEQDLQHMLLRQRALRAPRSPDDER